MSQFWTKGSVMFLVSFALLTAEFAAAFLLILAFELEFRKTPPVIPLPGWVLLAFASWQTFSGIITIPTLLTLGNQLTVLCLVLVSSLWVHRRMNTVARRSRS
jgi:hypothetical protein